jgi:glycosyltransferase involved in cell wall biosynthesis
MAVLCLRLGLRARLFAKLPFCPETDEDLRGTRLAEIDRVTLPSHIPVAVFMNRFKPGGTERQITELIRRMDPARFRVHVACFHREGAWVPRIVERAASIVEFPIEGFARLSTPLQLLAFARWCRREHIAVVQTCDLYANIFGLPGAALAGVPVRIGSRQELDSNTSDRQIRLQRLAYRFATKVVANSPAALEILEREGVAASSIAVIPNGVDLGAFPERAGSASIRTIITVANLRREKSHETLLAAAAVLLRTHPQLRFQIVGDGPRRAELEELSQARGLAGHVEFLGQREDVPSLLAAADAFVLPSRSEAFPNGAIEAMAAGLPVVASDVGGMRDLIANGRTGVLVPPGDPEALALAVASLIDNPADAAALGRAARREVQQRYSFDRMTTGFEDLYLSALRARPSGRRREAEAARV